MKMPRLAIILSALVAAVLVIVVLGAWLLPRLIDSQLIRDKIGSQFAIRSQGSLRFGKITILWFPRPSVVVENAEIAFGDQTRAAIRTVKIYPSMFYLLIGRWVPRQALLEQAQLRMRMAERTAKPINLEELESQIHTALAVLTSHSLAQRIDVSDGSAEISIGDHPALVLENVAAQTVGSSAELRFQLSARSNLCERLKIEGWASPQDLTSRFDIGVYRLKIKESLKLLALPIADYLQTGEASLDVKMAATGLRKLKASIDGSIGPLVLARHGGTANFEAKRLKGGISYEGGALQADVEQLDLGTPRLQASGMLKVLADSFSASFKVRDGDIAQIRELALQMSDNPEGIKSTLRFVPAGTITEMNFHSASRSFAEMASIKNIELDGTVRNGKIRIPGPDLELTNVSASVRITDNILEGKDISANLGMAKGWNGKLRLGLAGETAPFHLDMSVNTGAPELRALLLKIVTDESFRKQLLQVQNVEGELSGRLILGETLDAIVPLVAVSQADISATYAPVPFPITIRGGRFNYDQRIMRLENARATVGRSSFVGLNVTWHHDGSRQIEVDSGRVSLDLQQADTLLRSFNDLRAIFTKFQSVRGQLELQKLKLAGAYDDLAGWVVASTGSFSQVEMQHADFPERVSLSRAKFAIEQGRVRFSDAAVTMSDAAFIAGGTFEYKQGRAIQFETRGSASVGSHMTQWFSRYLELPDVVKLRSPLTVAAGRLSWRASGDLSFAGQVTVASGPQLSVEAVKDPNSLALKNLTIDDGGRRARMNLQLAPDQLDLSFSGELRNQTIDKLFVSFPTQALSLQGDIRVTAALADPITVTARGQLSGSNLSIPWGTDKTLVEKFRIEADGNSVAIRSADLRWGQSQLTASGKVSVAKELLRVDLDVTADQLDWERLQRSLGGTGNQRQPTKTGDWSIPAVEGTIRLKTERFGFDGFNLTSLAATADISSSAIRTEIHRADVCGIQATGRVDVADQDISLDLQLSATDAPLGPTSVCLSNRQSDISGTYSLAAHIAGRGDRERLRSVLKGDFQLSARDGEFVRAEGVDAAFDYLNGSGDFAVNFPDLNRQAFPYRLLSIKGRIDGEVLAADEVIVQSSLLDFNGHGEVDLARKQIDAKALIAVLKPVNDVIRRIPLVGALLGGSIVGIPVRVTGSLERPDVSYLSPSDVGMELLNVPMRLLGLPLGAIRLFSPGGDADDKAITQ